MIYTDIIENSSNSIYEAMALGMPVIATSTGGTGSLISHGNDGILVPPGDPFLLASEIRRLAVDTGTAATLGARARQTALARHNPHAVLQNLSSIYLEMQKGAV